MAMHKGGSSTGCLNICKTTAAQGNNPCKGANQAVWARLECIHVVMQVYEAFDNSYGFYSNKVDPVNRSHTSIPFRYSDLHHEGPQACRKNLCIALSPRLPKCSTVGPLVLTNL